MSDAPLQPPIDRLLAIMARLRDPRRGCEWDLAQNFATIAPYTIEEAYEVADAIERGDMADLRSELGDLLLQVVFHARMAEEAGLFSFDDVAAAIADKMEARHPHIFGDESGSMDSARWEDLKASERAEAGAQSAMDGVASALPALMRSEKLQKRAARVGFDWPSTREVLDKITEECAELAEAQNSGDQEHVTEEFGDLMFVMANLARHLKIDPEAALRSANAKFTRRFAAIEEELAARGSSPEQSTLDEMDAIWNDVKAKECQ